MYEGYLIDLDGTMYRGNEPIEGAKEFIRFLIENDLPHLFITNNSTSTQKAVVDKLRSFDIHTTETQVLTSAVAASNYMKEMNLGSRCYMIGEVGLEQALLQNQFTLTEDGSDYVVIGLDRQLTYEKLAQACLFIRDGATFISTNKDAAVPTEKGLMPGNGSITAAVSVSTGVEPIYIGKPESIMMNQALQKIGLHRDNVLMIGDNYTTDIMAGINANIATLMVLTGFSTKRDIETVTNQPTYIATDLLEWMDRIK